MSIFFKFFKIFLGVVVGISWILLTGVPGAFENSLLRIPDYRYPQYGRTIAYIYKGATFYITQEQYNSLSRMNLANICLSVMVIAVLAIKETWEWYVRPHKTQKL